MRTNVGGSTVIDFGRVSLDMLLKMARDAQLIEYYERGERHTLIVVHETRHVVTHATARGFLQEILIDWWNRQLEQLPPVSPDGPSPPMPDPLL